MLVGPHEEQRGSILFLTILAGTDANQAPVSPSPIQHGEALHDELGLFVGTGLTPVEALRSATLVPAVYLG